MSFKNTPTFLIIAVLLSSLFSCQQEKDIKPDDTSNEITCDTVTNFEVTSPAKFTTTRARLDIALLDRDSLRFSGNFNQEVTWTITITDLSHPTDYAIKKISRTSDKLDPQLDFWCGDSDNMYFFKKNQNVKVELSFCGIPNSTIDLGQIELKRTPTSFNDRLIMNFEKEPENKALLKPYSDILVYNMQKSELITSDNSREPSRHQNLNLPHPIEGNSYLHLHGKLTSDTNDIHYIGGMNHSTLSFRLDGSTNETFLNFYANSNGNTNTKLEVQIKGIYGNLFSKEIDVTWTGWQLVSISLSDFVRTKSGALGTGVLTPSFLKNMSFKLLSKNGKIGDDAEILLDYVTFTKGGPFRQSK